MVSLKPSIIKSMADQMILQAVRHRTLPRLTYWRLDRKHLRELETNMVINIVWIDPAPNLELLAKQEFSRLQN